MSSPLALAGVSACLRDLLNNAMVDQDISGAVGGNVTISNLPPDRVIGAAGTESNQLNLFLHRVSRNTGWSNVALASRDSAGHRLTNPPLALDLEYLLTAYGTDSLHAEVLLGYGMHVLHENPVLTRGAIRQALTVPAVVNGSILPPAFSNAQAADLADQVEQIKLTPAELSTEEMSKVWSNLGANYRPTAVYRVSVVLIEASQPTITPLPVLSRGPVDPITNKDAGVAVQASLIPPYPTLEELRFANQQTVARMGETVHCSGHHLAAQQVGVRLTSARGENTLSLATTSATAAGFDFALPPVPAVGSPPADSPLNPDNWRAGHYQVAGVLTDPGTDDRLTNELSLTLAPRIDQITVATAAGETTIDVDVAPAVWRDQTAALVLGTQQLAADPLVTDRTATLRFRADTADLPSGQQWVRLLIDDVSSVLIDRSGPMPTFDPTQAVVL